MLSKIIDETIGYNNVKVTLREGDDGVYINVDYTTKRGYTYTLRYDESLEENLIMFYDSRLTKFAYEFSELRGWNMPVKALQIFNRLIEIYGTKA